MTRIPEEDPAPHTISLSMRPVMGGDREKLILDGVDISKHVRRATITGDPGELVKVNIDIYPAHGVELPEQLANVVVIDGEETILLRNLVHDIYIAMSEAGVPVSNDLFHRMKRLMDGPAERETLAKYRKRRDDSHGQDVDASDD